MRGDARGGPHLNKKESKKAMVDGWGTVIIMAAYECLILMHPSVVLGCRGEK